MFNIEHDTCSTLEVGQGKCSKYEHASCSTMLDMTHVQQLFKLNMHPVQLDWARWMFKLMNNHHV